MTGTEGPVGNLEVVAIWYASLSKLLTTQEGRKRQRKALHSTPARRKSMDINGCLLWSLEARALTALEIDLNERVSRTWQRCALEGAGVQLQVGYSRAERKHVSETSCTSPFSCCVGTHGQAFVSTLQSLADSPAECCAVWRCPSS